MDRHLDAEARRLVAAAMLTARTRSVLGARLDRVDGDDLLVLARRLRDEASDLEHRLGVRFAPSFPGATAGVEVAGGAPRLVLGCVARSVEGQPLHAVFTTLICGRRPMVAVAPAEARIPREWRPLDDAA